MPRAFGYIATSATTEVAVNGTTYTEQTSGAQRSLKSSSVNDAAAGTGARTVRVTYCTLASDGTITGPFSEVVTLNGTTAVAMVATNVALIDRIEVLTVGSGGVPAGAISLYTDNAGAGSVIASIAAGDMRTYMAHAYVPSGRHMHINDVILDSGEAVTVESSFRLKALPYPSANQAEAPITNNLRMLGLQGAKKLEGTGRALAVVAGPARVQLYVAPGAATATTQRGEFGFQIV